MPLRSTGGRLNRRALLSGATTSALAGLTLLGMLDRASTVRAQAPRRPTPAEALERLIAGNRRFALGEPSQADVSAARRAELAGGQRPFAAIVSCSDSRVPPEIVFDQGLGDLFVCRLAGNIVDVGTAGSVEYAVGVLGVSYIFVLGHESCGAVKAAVDVTANGQPISPNIDVLVNAIRASVEAARDEPGDLLTNAIRENVRTGIRRLMSEPDIAPFLAEGRVGIGGGVLNLTSGAIDLIPAP
jgi:carbonic anhydrase